MTDGLGRATIVLPEIDSNQWVVASHRRIEDPHLIAAFHSHHTPEGEIATPQVAVTQAAKMRDGRPLLEVQVSIVIAAPAISTWGLADRSGRDICLQD